MKAIPKTYELVKEEESMNLIKIQNKKINTLINQLEQKESLLKQYETKLSLMDKDKTVIQSSTLPNKHSYLQTTSKPICTSIDTDVPLSNAFETITHSHIKDAKQKETEAKLLKENNLLATKINSNALTIQKLNETITMQNNKIDSLFTRINDLNSVIANQENTIGVINKSKSSIEKKRAQDKQMHDNEMKKYKDEIDSLHVELNERDKVNKKIIKDNELFNEQYEEMNRRIRELIEDNKSLKGKNDKMGHEQQDNEIVIQNYKSKLNQFEYLINSKDNYHQEYINEIENISDKYSSAIYQAIEWGNNNIGIKENGYLNCNIINSNDSRGGGECSFSPRLLSIGTDCDYESKLKRIYDIIVNMTTNLNNKIREEYSLYEKEIQGQHSSHEKYIDQIKEMTNRIKCLDLEIKQLRDQSDDQANQYSLNESYYQQSIGSLNKKIQNFEVNLDLVVKECLRQFRDNFTGVFLQQDNNSIISTIHSIELAKENNNPLNAIEVLFNQIMDYCKWLLNDNQLKKKIKNDNEMLYNENQKIIEENMQLKRTIQNNGKHFSMEKMEILNTLNHKKNSEVYERDKAFADEIRLLKEFIANHEEDNERLKNDHHSLKNQYTKLEKTYEDYKKNQKQYEEHLLMQNEEMHRKYKELEGNNLKLQTDIEIGNMQLGNLKNALQEQIEQTRETLTNYSTTN